MKIKLKDVLTIVLVILCVGALIVVAKLSNNFTTDIKTFYVKVDGKMVTERGEFMLDDTAVEVCNVLNKITSHPTDFDIKIVRNTSADSPVFYADGNKSTLADIADYTNCFEIMRTNNGFNQIGFTERRVEKGVRCRENRTSAVGRCRKEVFYNRRITRHKLHTA